jgi:hypothetical protein
MSIIYISAAFCGAITLLYITVMIIEKIAEIADKTIADKALEAGGISGGEDGVR